MTILFAVLFVFLGYVIGAVPTGLIVARLRGIDIRSMGSGNIGATNVLRSMGVAPAAVVALVDPVKGAVATLLPLLFGMPEWVVGSTAVATVIGNDFNVFLGFRGGKGIATTTGAFLVINPAAALFGLFMGLFTIVLGRLVSLGSMVAVVSVLSLLIVTGDAGSSDFWVACAMVTLAFFQHRENLRRLAKGTERRLGSHSPRG